MVLCEAGRLESLDIFEGVGMMGVLVAITGWIPSEIMKKYTDKDKRSSHPWPVCG
jgi:hypothetical protein